MNTNVRPRRIQTNLINEQWWLKVWIIYEMKRCKLKNKMDKLKGCFQMIIGCSLIINGLKWGSIYNVCEKLVFSSRYAYNLFNSIDQSVQAVNYTTLAVTIAVWQVPTALLWKQWHSARSTEIGSFASFSLSKTFFTSKFYQKSLF